MGNCMCKGECALHPSLHHNADKSNGGEQSGSVLIRGGAHRLVALTHGSLPLEPELVSGGDGGGDGGSMPISHYKADTDLGHHPAHTLSLTTL